MSKERDPYFDNLRGMLIFLVVAGHCFNIYRDSNPYCNYLFHLIYAFHMPLFFFISGYFSKNVEKSYKTAFASLIIPAIPFELLYYLMHVLTKADNTEYFLTPIFAYWFCFALFFCRVLLPYLSKIRGIVPIAFILALAAGFNPSINEYMSLSRFLCMLPFFMLGYYATESTIDRFRSANRYVAVIAGVVAAAVVFVLMNYTDENLGFTLKSAYESNMGIFLRGAQFILVFPFAFMIMRLTPQKKSYLSLIGQRTLQIYFLHFYLTTAIKMANLPLGQGLLNCAIMLVIAMLITIFLSTRPTSMIYDELIKLSKKILLRQGDEK